MAYPFSQPARHARRLRNDGYSLTYHIGLQISAPSTSRTYEPRCAEQVTLRLRLQNLRPREEGRSSV